VIEFDLTHVWSVRVRLCVCVCVCVRACACVRLCVYGCASVQLKMETAMSWGSVGDFGRKVLADIGSKRGSLAIPDLDGGASWRVVRPCTLLCVHVLSCAPCRCPPSRVRALVISDAWLLQIDLSRPNEVSLHAAGIRHNMRIVVLPEV
jgi:hypothetical protein